MRRIKPFGIAVIVMLALGTATAATAHGEEPGLLFLSGEKAPVTLKGEVTTGSKLEALGLLTGSSVTCSATKLTMEAGTKTGEETHVTLGTATFDYTGCKFNKKIACSSENLAGEKDPKETVLQAKEDTDLHLVSLLNGTKLLAGVLVGLLELTKETKKLDLTMNCGGTKILVLGATFLSVLGVSASEDNTKVELTPTSLNCDESDKSCQTLLKEWEVIATLKNGEKDEKVGCGLGIFIEKEEEVASFTLEKPIPVEISKMVLVDF